MTEDHGDYLPLTLDRCTAREIKDMSKDQLLELLGPYAGVLPRHVFSGASRSTVERHALMAKAFKEEVRKEHALEAPHRNLRGFDAQARPNLPKAAREGLHMTQEQFAHAVGVSFATANRWENERFSPTPENAARIRELLLWEPEEGDAVMPVVPSGTETGRTVPTVREVERGEEPTQEPVVVCSNGRRYPKRWVYLAPNGKNAGYIQSDNSGKTNVDAPTDPYGDGGTPSSG